MRLLILLIASSTLWGAARTASVTGTWANTATWGGAAAPVSGDTVTINDGITVTVAANATVGDAANLGTYAIRTAGTGGTGILIVNPGVTLTLQGHVLQGNATWQIGTTAGGADIIFDHATTTLEWNISDASSQANAKLQIRGASGDRSTFTKTTALYSFKPLTTAVVDGGRVDAQYADFTSCGSTTLSCFAFRGVSSAFTFTLTRVKLTSSGQITQVGAVFGGAANLLLDYVRVTAPQVASTDWINFAPTNRSTGTWSITNSVFEDSNVHCNPGAGTPTTLDMTWTNVLVRNSNTAGTWSDGCGSVRMGTMTNIMQALTGSTVNIGGASIGGATINGFYMLDQGASTTSNSHPLQSLKYTSDIYNWVVESTGSQEQGDAIQQMNSASVTSENITVRDGVVIQPAGGFWGIISNLSSPNAHGASFQFPNITVKNFTWRGGYSGGTPFGSNQSGASGGEGSGNQGKAGLYPFVGNHIVWAETSTAAAITDFYGSSTGVTPPDAGTYTTVGYNNYWQITGHATDGLYKYSVSSPTVYTNTPGTGDTNINPRFPDTTRNFLNWGKSINASHTTIAQVLDELCKMTDDSGYDPRYTIEALLKWTRWGHVPQEPRLWVSGLSGTYVGGVDPTPLKIASAASNF
jgi:hypothetical protein